MEEGSVGAGTGATVGKAMGMNQAIKAGIGTASLTLGDGIIVGALVAVNAYGSIVDHIHGKLVAGPRNDDRDGFCSTVEFLLNGGLIWLIVPELYFFLVIQIKILMVD